MKKKTAFGVFTLTDSGLDYLVKGNFGDDKDKADAWAKDNDVITHPVDEPAKTEPMYPHGLFVKEVKY